MSPYQDLYIKREVAKKELESLERQGAGWRLKRRMRAVIMRWDRLLEDEFQRRLVEQVETQEKIIDDFEKNKIDDPPQRIKKISIKTNAS